MTVWMLAMDDEEKKQASYVSISNFKFLMPFNIHHVDSHIAIDTTTNCTLELMIISWSYDRVRAIYIL